MCILCWAKLRREQ
uniref:Uncharacterized protein n=1 Tax=Arundo donax TaxID=35708 RepID=A0A0A9ABA6_ARUDO